MSKINYVDIDLHQAPSYLEGDVKIVLGVFTKRNQYFNLSTGSFSKSFGKIFVNKTREKVRIEVSLEINISNCRNRTLELYSSSKQSFHSANWTA